MIHIKYNIDYLRLFYSPYPLLPVCLPLIHHRSPSSSQSQHRGAEMAGETVKRGPFPALLVMLTILLRTSDCGATSSIMKDNATSPYHARMDEPGLIFDSEITRMLIDAGHHSQLALNPKKPAVPTCDRPPRYASCLDQANGKKPPPLCGTYDRICPKN